jgi:hypothetical protein
VDPVRYFENVRHVVADQDHRQATLLDLRDQLQHLTGLLHAQGSGRFVQDDEPRGERGRSGHRDRLPLTTGQGLDRLRHVLHRGDAEIAHRFAGLGLHALLVEHPENRA